MLMVDKNDIVICLSKSGNSTEIKTLVPIVKNRGNKLIGMTANPGSYLGKNSDALLHVDIACEADPNNLAPTSSTTAQLSLGDALSIALMKMKNFGQLDFKKFHPAGSLANKLKTASDLMLTKNKIPFVNENEIVRSALKILKDQ